ncbi:MAG: hypothetical protein HY394_04485 [Candidatus Diapherotrites archaeon]|nr:hypothetical protein [Candidatus Diapherotrites archaeon]
MANKFLVAIVVLAVLAAGYVLFFSGPAGAFTELKSVYAKYGVNAESDYLADKTMVLESSKRLALKADLEEFSAGQSGGWKEMGSALSSLVDYSENYAVFINSSNGRAALFTGMSDWPDLCPGMDSLQSFVDVSKKLAQSKTVFESKIKSLEKNYPNVLSSVKILAEGDGLVAPTQETISESETFNAGLKADCENPEVNFDANQE